MDIRNPGKSNGLLDTGSRLRLVRHDDCVVAEMMTGIKQMAGTEAGPAGVSVLSFRNPLSRSGGSAQRVHPTAMSGLPSFRKARSDCPESRPLQAKAKSP